MRRRSFLLLAVLALPLFLAGCPNKLPPGAFTLQILHTADMDGTSGALDNVGFFAALLEHFKTEHPDNTVVLSSGDNYIPGPRYFAASADNMASILGIPGNGRGDIALLNAMGFQASAVGNHDLDEGTGAFAGIISREDDGAGNVYSGALFPYLSSNLDFSTDGALAPLVTADNQDIANGFGKVAASATIEVNGQTIGIVGATTPRLASITSTGGITINPNDPDDMNALAAAIQPSIDALTAQDIDKIILLAHMQQIDIEKQLASLLNDVDVIIAGGSNTLLADANDTLRPGDAAADTYPLEFRSPKGDPVLVVNTDGDYKYLGRLVVTFNKNGHLVPGLLDETDNGAWAATQDVVDNVVRGKNRNAVLDQVDEIVQGLKGVLADRDSNILGKTAVYLDGRRSQVRTQETNLGNLTADANLHTARMADPSVMISLKNGGGIRDDIGLVYQPPGSTDPSEIEFLVPPANPDAGKEEGDISQFDVEGTLRFNNGLTLLTVTAEELRDIMEHAVSATADGATPGQFPQVAGLRFSFDPGMAPREGTDTNGDFTVAGDRLRSLAIVDDSGAVIDTVVQNGVVVGDPTRTYRMVILDFIAKCVDNPGESCGDSYPLNGLAAPNRVDLKTLGLDDGLATFADAGTEQDALAEYLLKNFSMNKYNLAETPVEDDFRIQNLSIRSDNVFDLPPSSLTIGKIGGLATGDAEIVVYSPESQRLFVTGGDTVAIIDIINPAAPQQIGTIDPATDIGAGFIVGGVNSVAVNGNLVAVAVEADGVADTGKVALYDTDGNFLGALDAGVLPDMVTFNHAGTQILAANEAEPSDDYLTDPEGSVTVVDLPAAGTAQERANAAVATQIEFTAFNGQEAALRNEGVRIFGPNATAAQDFEPEYIAVSSDDSTAYVSMQENNALAEIDLATGTVTDIIALGNKDHSLADNAMDLAENGIIALRTWPIRGMYMPDAIAGFSVNGMDYLISANEGDAREYSGFEEEVKLEDVILDPLAFTAQEIADLQDDDFGAGNLKFTNTLGDNDNDGDFDEIYTFGARSFSIWSPIAGQNPVFDSGDDIERVTAQATPGLFNANDGLPSEMDERSANKGPEPEAVTTGMIGDSIYGFIGLERAGGGFLTYNLDNPEKPMFVTYTPGVNGADQDISTEGMIFIADTTSPNGSPLVVTANEESGTVAIYQIDTP